MFINQKQNSIGVKFNGINIDDDRFGLCNCISINARPEFKGLSIEELRYNDYIFSKTGLLPPQPKPKINQLIQNVFIKEDFEISKCKELNLLNDNDGEIIGKNDNHDFSFLLNFDKKKKNKINIEVNDNIINITVNQKNNIEVNCIDNSIIINKNSININCNPNSLSINTNDNIKNSSIKNISIESLLEKQKNKLPFSDINNISIKKNNIFGIINKSEIKEEDKEEDKEESKIDNSETIDYNEEFFSKNNISKRQKRFKHKNMTVSNSFDNTFNNKIPYQINLFNQKYNFTSHENSEDDKILFINCHITEPYNTSFLLKIRKNTEISKLKEIICRKISEKIILNNNTLNSESFILIKKNYSLIEEKGNVDSILSNKDDIYVTFKKSEDNFSDEE